MNRIFLTATFLTSVAYADGQVCPPNQQQQAPVQQAPVEQSPTQQAPVCPPNQQQQQPNQQQTPVCPPANNQQQAPVDQTPVQQPNQQQQPNNQQQAPVCPPNNNNQQQQAPNCTPTAYDQLNQAYATSTQYTHPEAVMGRFGGRCFNVQTPNQPRPFLFEAKGFYTQPMMPWGGMPAQILAARFVYDEQSANVADYDTFIRQVSWSASNADFGEPVQNSYYTGPQDTGSVMFRVPAYGYAREIHVKRVGNEILVRYENNFCSAQAL